MPPLWRSRFNFLLSLAADVTLATGIVPARNLVLLRAGVLCVVFQQWVAATVSGFILPRSMPLTLVYILYHRWLTFTEEKVAAFRQAKETLERAAKASSGSFSPSETNAQSTTHAGRRKGTSREVSGYDVSNASGEEVVELSSWTDTSSSSMPEKGSDIRMRMKWPK